MTVDQAVASGVTPGELGVRVGLLERRDIDIEKQVNAIRDTMATKADIASLGSQIAALAQLQREASKPNYSVLIAAVTLGVMTLGLLGGFAYWPISSATNDLKATLAVVNENTVRVQRYNTDQDRLTRSLEERDRDLKDIIEAQRAGLQREIDNLAQKRGP